MGSSYYQFCPVAKAMELLDERWTLLIVRELLAGSERFNDLRRGLTRMSPSLLSKRLHQLALAGIVRRHSDGPDVRYVLTEAGQELRPAVEALGAWGIRWIGELGDRDLDPKLLLWDMQRNIDHAVVPDGRCVVEFGFSDVPAKISRWWLVITTDNADVCDIDPGFPIAVTVSTSLRQMIGIWRGDVTWAVALRSGTIDLQGTRALRRELPGWFKRSPFASVPRAGRRPLS